MGDSKPVYFDSAYLFTDHSFNIIKIFQITQIASLN